MAEYYQIYWGAEWLPICITLVRKQIIT